MMSGSSRSNTSTSSYSGSSNGSSTATTTNTITAQWELQQEWGKIGNSSGKHADKGRQATAAPAATAANVNEGG